VLALSAWLGSVVLFGFGLVAPLTPSHGCPTALDVVVFGCLPTALAATAALGMRGVPRGFLVLQAIVTLAATLWLLDRIGCLA
jgi:hypothetical protein